MITALHREVREEAGAVFKDSLPYALLSMGRPQSMLVYATDAHEMIGEWQAYGDCLERAELKPERFIASYHGHKDCMRALINAALSALRSQSL